MTQIKSEWLGEIEQIKLISPVEWEDTHIEAHELLNRAVSQFYSHLKNTQEIIEEIKISIRDVDDEYSSAFSKLEKEIKDMESEHTKTLDSIVSKIEMLEEKVSKPKKYLVKNFEWILDTDTQIVSELDKIELDWTYLVNIVVKECVPNWWVITYSFPQTSIATNEYTPHLYLMAKEWEHAVLEYGFNVILTEI